MEFAFINDNRVVKIEDHESLEEIDTAHLFQNVINISSLNPKPVVGWIYDKGLLISNLTPLKPRQLRLALLGAGITMDMVAAVINTFPEPQKTYASIEWEYAVEIKRSEALVAGLGAALGLTASQIDQIWINGAKL